MSKYFKSIKIFLKEGERTIPLAITITTAANDKKSNDYFCDIEISKIFREKKRIYGIDKAQAEYLSINFVRSILHDKALVDKNGMPVDLQNL